MAFDNNSTTFYAPWILGRDICGHAGIVHGGMVALLLDDTIGRMFGLLKVRGEAMQTLGVTATLNITYRKPMPGMRYVLLEVTMQKKEGRKVVMGGVVKDGLDGDIYAEASSMYVSLAPGADHLKGKPEHATMWGVLGE